MVFGRVLPGKRVRGGWSALLRHEFRVVALNPSTPIFLASAWILAAALALFAGNMLALNRASLEIFFGYIPWVLALVVPALAMGGWAEDWRRGVAERVFTLPVSVAQVVLVRFMVLWLLLGVFMLGTWPLVVTVAWLGDPDWGPIVTGYVGGWLLAGVMLSFALAVSAVSSGAVVAFVSAFLVLLVVLFSGWSAVVDVLEGWLPGGMIVSLRESSLLEHYRRFVIGTVDGRSVVYLLGLLGLGLGSQLAVVARRLERGFSGLGWWVPAVGGVAVAVVCWVASPLVSLRLDATADGVYTLSPASKALLADLEKPVEFVLYDSRTNPDVPVESRLVGRRLLDLLDDIQAENPHMVKVRRVNPDLRVDDEFAAQQEGLVEQELPGGQGFYLGLVARMDGRDAVVPGFEPDRLPYLEFDLMSVLAEVRKIEKKTMTVLSVTNLRMVKLRPTWLNELSGFYNVNYMLPGQPEVPADTDVLVVLMTPYLPQESLYAIDQYVVKGGRLMLLMDPYFRSAPDEETAAADRNADGFAFDHPADLVRGWGVDYDGMSVVGDPVLAATVDDPGLGFRTYPFWLHLGPENVNGKLPFTSFVDDLLLPEAGELHVRELAPGLVYEPVLSTTSKAQTVSRTTIDAIDPQLYATQLMGAPGQRDVAALVRGAFGSLFKAVPPAVVNYYMDYAPEGEEAKVPEQAMSGSKEGAMLVIADMDFVAPQFTVRPTGRAEGELAPVNDNLVFFFNALQYLAGEGELLGLRGKAVNPRPFTRVQEMLNRLGTRYVGLEQRMAADLYQVSERLKDLKQKRNEGQQVDAAAERDIKSFEARNLELRKQLREIRKNLRREVVWLERLLQAVNLVLMPAVLLVGYGWWRRRRVRLAEAK